MKACPYCAEQIQDEAVICRYCQRDLKTGHPPAPPVVVQAPPPTPPAPQWSPGVAAVLSLVIPGAGQMYKGQVGAGLAWLLFTILGYFALIVPGLVLHLICIVNAASGRAVNAASGRPATATNGAPVVRRDDSPRIASPEERAKSRRQMAYLFGGMLTLAVVSLSVAGLTGRNTPRATGAEARPGASTSRPTPTPSPSPAAKRPEAKPLPGANADAACRKDLKCFAEKQTAGASVYCKSVVERMAKNDFEWTDGFLEPKFSHYRWKDKEAAVVTHIGDKIKFQNGFGAWIHHTYECDLAPDGKTVLDVRASPGRLQ